MKNTRKTAIPAKNPVFGGFEVYDQDNELMFCCQEKKFQWYLSRNLATLIGPKSIRLNFKPFGPGNKGEPRTLLNKENKCVCCGRIDGLSRHHVVPYFYRKYFPELYKSHKCYDVVALCEDCHGTYEGVYAAVFKKEIARKYGVPKTEASDSEAGRKLTKVYKASRAFVSGKMENMTDERKHVLQERLIENFGHMPSKEEVTEFLSVKWTKRFDWKSFKEEGQLVVEKVEDIQKFTEMWREHFVTTMNPKYLPDGWTIDKPIIRPFDETLNEAERLRNKDRDITQESAS